MENLTLMIVGLMGVISVINTCELWDITSPSSLSFFIYKIGILIIILHMAEWITALQSAHALISEIMLFYMAKRTL